MLLESRLIQRNGFVMVDISNGICAYLQGGLGNQLFILATALEQSHRLGCPLYIDVSTYAKGKQAHPLNLNIFDLPGTLIDADSPWRDLDPRIPAPARRLIPKVSGLKVYREKSFSYSPTIHSITPGTTIYGYFQSAKYFPKVGGLIADMLETVPLPAKDSTTIEKLASTDFTTLHIRRGDYVSNPKATAHHGIAELEYFKRGNDLLNTLGQRGERLVFTDSPELVKSELGNTNPFKVSGNHQTLSEAGTLLAMSKASSFVMSNSTFSWWAAWLMNRRNGGFVISPRPWFKTGQAAEDLLSPEWITLDARN